MIKFKEQLKLPKEKTAASHLYRSNIYVIQLARSSTVQKRNTFQDEKT